AADEEQPHLDVDLILRQPVQQSDRKKDHSDELEEAAEEDVHRPLIRPSGTFSPQAGRRETNLDARACCPSPRLRGEGGPFGSAQGKLRPGEGHPRASLIDSGPQWLSTLSTLSIPSISPPEKGSSTR